MYNHSVKVIQRVSLIHATISYQAVRSVFFPVGINPVVAFFFVALFGDKVEF